MNTIINENYVIYHNIYITTSGKYELEYTFIIKKTSE